MTEHRSDHFFYWLLLTLAFFLAITTCNATVVSGVIKQQGQPFTGYVDIGLVYPGTNGTALSLPGSSGHISIYNGQFPQMKLDGNDILLPRGTFYQLTYLDQYMKPLARMNYVITGATFDIAAAVPTPVTTSNINFLDLIGIRNFSAQNVSINNSFQIGGGSLFTAAGVTGAKQFNDIRFSSGYAAGSATCGIQQAIDALPVTGGMVILPAGGCTITTGISITKPVKIMGEGLQASTIINGGSLTMFTVTGVRAALSDFTLSGNPGGGSGDNVTVINGTLIANNLQSITAKNWGVHLIGSVQTSITGSIITTNGSGGVLVEGGSTGTALSADYFSGNTGDNLQLLGTGVTDVNVSASYIGGATANGINVAAGAANAVLHLTSSVVSDNHNAGLLFAGGVGHTVDGVQILPGTHQLYGIYSNYASTANRTQIEVKDSTIAGNLTNDLFIGPLITGYVLYPPTVAFSDGTVHNSIDGSAHVTYVKAVGNGGDRVCNSNGCYKLATDGTIDSWGHAPTAPGSGSGVTLSITFPTPYTDTTNLSLVLTPIGSPGGDGNPHPMTCHVNSFTTTGASIVMAIPQQISGSGYDSPILSSQYCAWQAKGY